jgi:pSer/pThr/pTyr-binding forkhead associated (FHA) protein
MPTLILEQDGKRRGGRLRGRVVIGRRPNNHICIPDRSVSRIHAWIGQAEDGYFVSDTGSRAGTHVNGQPISGKAILKDGDRIRIGPAEITFRSTSTLPRGVVELDLSDRKLDSSDGIFVDCACGAPLWAPWDFAGRVGQCRYCGQMISLPQSKSKPAGADLSSETVFGGMPAIREDAPTPAKVSVARRPPIGAPKLSFFDRPQSGAAVAPAARPAEVATQTLCGACQSQISVLEETMRCPECGVTFHAECWTENRGCSSYGCSQVGVLDKTVREPVFAREIPFPAIEDVNEPRRIAWEYLLLPGSLVAAAVGALTFGVPAVLVLIGIGWAWPRISLTPRRDLVIWAAVSSLVGAIGGAWFSWYWWLAPPAMAVAR